MNECTCNDYQLENFGCKCGATKEEPAAIDYLVGIKAKAEKYDKALNILREVLEWIENWEPIFTGDPEWETLEDKAKELLEGK